MLELSPMKVGIDVFCSDHGRSGIGSYIQSFVKNIDSLKNNPKYSDIEFELFGSELDRFTFNNGNTQINYKGITISDTLSAERGWHNFKLNNFAKKNNMFLHMDGARISNAAVALGCSFKEISGDLGVDVLSFGGTKNGLMFGEALIFFNKELAKDFAWIRKQNLQLYSKMRFLSAQFIPYIQDNIWYECAKNANDIAQYLKLELEKIQIPVTKEVLANAVFAILPEEIIPELQSHFYFYIWDENIHEVRLVTSFDSTKEDVDSLIEKIKELLGK